MCEFQFHVKRWKNLELLVVIAKSLKDHHKCCIVLFCFFFKLGAGTK